MENPVRANIQVLLSKEGQKVEDFLYFIPTGAMPDPKDETAFSRIDLRENKVLYDRLFTGDITEIRALDRNPIPTIKTIIVQPETWVTL